MSVLAAAFAVLIARVSQVDAAKAQVPRKANGGHAYRNQDKKEISLTFDVPSKEGWHAISGLCQTYTTETSVCFSDAPEGNNYGNNMECEFAYVGDATLTWEEFDVEAYYYHMIEEGYPLTHYECTARDYLVVDDTAFCGVEEPKLTGERINEYKTGTSNYFAPSSKTFDVTGVTRFKFKSGFETTYKGFAVCAPKLAPAAGDVIDSLAKLKTWCSANTSNCVTCRGEFDGSKCITIPKVIAKCRKFKGNAVCDLIVGCRTKTNKKGKTKCKGKKHGLA